MLRIGPERIFAGDFIGEAEVKQRALAWVPEPMRFAPDPEPAEATQSDELPPWEEEPASDDAHHASDAESGSGEDDAGSDGTEPFEVEEAA